VAKGDPLSYTLTVRNIGSITAENVVVTDSLPDGVTFISATPSQGSCDGTTCSLGSLAPGEAAVISLVVNVDDDAVSPLVNIACVATSTPETDLTNNCDEEETEIKTPTPTPLGATKTPDGLPPTGGGALGGDAAGWALLLVLGAGLAVTGAVATFASRKRARSG
jgi:uncharacterized repeat protein (TIGR01451 family)